jgi:hypothetical protein
MLEKYVLGSVLLGGGVKHPRPLGSWVQRSPGAQMELFWPHLQYAVAGVLVLEGQVGGDAPHAHGPVMRLRIGHCV